MAGARFTIVSFVTPNDNPISRRTYPLVVVSSIPNPSPSKLKRRKNYLRPKILKILTKPHSPITPLPPTIPIPAPQTPEEDDLFVETSADGTTGESSGSASEGEVDKLEEFQVSEGAGEHNVIPFDISARSILKYGAYLVGVLVLQSIFSFWILGGFDSERKSGDSDVNVRGKKDFLWNGDGNSIRVRNASNALYLEDEFELEKKIEEIKIMAREARREEERKKKEEEAGDSEFNDELATRRLDIEKEINARLENLQSKVNFDKGKTYVKSTDGSAGDSINVKQGGEELMFKKKFKFKSPSIKPTKTPKGFQGKRGHRASNGKERDSSRTITTQENGTDSDDHMQKLYENKQVDQQGTELSQSDSRPPLKDGGDLVGGESKNLKTETGIKSKVESNGGVKKPSFGRSSVEVTQSGKSKELRVQNSLGFFQENRDTDPILEKDDVLSINGNPEHGLAENTSAANTVKANQANTESDMWWLNLRYVLVIIMRRGFSKEGTSGLFSVKVTAQEQDRTDYSYTVAFEDHADANNFCLLLESFFGDLGDFSADAAPMSVQELHEAVKSHAKKVIVVKKRQLQLYAGQPLADVEMALCSLIEQDQNVRSS